MGVNHSRPTGAAVPVPEAAEFLGVSAASGPSTSRRRGLPDPAGPARSFFPADTHRWFMLKIPGNLDTLVARGFEFTYPHDRQGALLAALGIRVHHGVIDIVQLYGEQDSQAARVPDEEADVLFPRTVLWRTTGTDEEIVDAAVALADPAPDRTPHRAGRAQVPAPGHPLAGPDRHRSSHVDGPPR